MKPAEIWKLDTLLTDEELDLLAFSIASSLAVCRGRDMDKIASKLGKLGTRLINEAYPYHPEEEFEND